MATEPRLKEAFGKLLQQANCIDLSSAHADALLRHKLKLNNLCATRICGASADISDIVFQSFPCVKEISFFVRTRIPTMRCGDNFVDNVGKFPHESVRNQLTKVENIPIRCNSIDSVRYCVYLIWWCENLKEISCFVDPIFEPLESLCFKEEDENVLMSWLETRGKERKMERIEVKFSESVRSQYKEREDTMKQLEKMFEKFGIIAEEVSSKLWTFERF